MRIVNMGQELGPCVPQRHTAAEQIPRGLHISGRDISLGPHAPTAQHRKLMGVDRIVFRFAPVHGLHGERMAQDEGNIFPGAEIGEPGPR